MISPNLCSILFLQHISEAQKAKDVPVSPRVESSEIEVFRCLLLVGSILHLFFNIVKVFKGGRGGGYLIAGLYFFHIFIVDLL